MASIITVCRLFIQCFFYSLLSSSTILSKIADNNSTIILSFPSDHLHLSNTYVFELEHSCHNNNYYCGFFYQIGHFKDLLYLIYLQNRTLKMHYPNKKG